jgi:hypothetical protein
MAANKGERLDLARDPSRAQWAKQSLYHPDAGQRADADDAPLLGLGLHSTGNLVPRSLMPTPTHHRARVTHLIMLTPARPPGLFTTAATSLTAVPSVLHAVAPRRVACEFPGGIVSRLTTEDLFI